MDSSDGWICDADMLVALLRDSDDDAPRKPQQDVKVKVDKFTKRNWELREDTTPSREDTTPAKKQKAEMTAETVKTEMARPSLYSETKSQQTTNSDEELTALLE